MSKNILHEVDDKQKYFLPNDKLDGMSKKYFHEVDKNILHFILENLR
jgi:hypothetical protein